jgi:hypothetical protein
LQIEGKAQLQEQSGLASEPPPFEPLFFVRFGLVLRLDLWVGKVPKTQKV